MKNGTNISSIVEDRLCCGCGGCCAGCPSGAIEIIEGESYNYASVNKSLCASCGLCIEICPQEACLGKPGGDIDYRLGASADDEIRRESASGGLVTALLLDQLASGAIDGAVVVAASQNRPFHTRAFLARTPDDIIAARSSKYLPASACSALSEVASTPGKFAFVGKPCEISSLERLCDKLPVLLERVAIKIAIFCAQTPSRMRTRELIEERGLRPEEIKRIAYRGGGWPGKLSLWGKDRLLHNENYHEAWEFLASGLPSIACFLCGDGTGINADISVGDPWGLPDSINAGEGLSLALVRTDKGREAFDGAVSRGAVSAEAAPKRIMERIKREQAARVTKAKKRRVVHRALFDGDVRWKSLFRSRLSGLPTLLKRRFSKEYY